METLQSEEANCNKMPQIQEEKRSSSYALLVEFTGGGGAPIRLFPHEPTNFTFSIFFSRTNVLDISLSS